MSTPPTPVVGMNRAIAPSEERVPRIGLSGLDELGGALESYHRIHAARGFLLRRLGRIDAAVTAYDQGSQLAPAESDRRFLWEMVYELNALDQDEAPDRAGSSEEDNARG